MQAIHDLRLEECVKLAEIFHITIDEDKYWFLELHTKKGKLDKLQVILKHRLSRYTSLLEYICEKVAERQQHEKDLAIKIKIRWDPSEVIDLVFPLVPIGQGQATAAVRESREDLSTITSFLDQEIMEAKIDNLKKFMKDNCEKPTLMPEFSGERNQDIEDHIEDLETIQKLRLWNNVKLIENFVSTLRGLARDYFMKIVVKSQNQLTWDEIKKQMTERFQRNQQDWENELLTTKQKPNEDPRDLW